jgi:hypothetical protein
MRLHILLTALLQSSAFAFQAPHPNVRVVQNRGTTTASKHDVVGVASPRLHDDGPTGPAAILSAASRSRLPRLSQSSTPGDDGSNPSIFSSFSAPFGIAWLCLVLWAFSPLAPGSLGSAQDSEMLTAIIANPVSPGINELYYTFFNFFATIPVILACLVLPQGSKAGLPAGPFLALSSAIGYFAMGPYLALRAPPVSTIQEKEGSMSWVTANVFENKLFNWSIFLFTLYLPVAANVFGAYAADPAALWQGFVDIVSTSRFAGVSMVDISILYAAAVYLTPRDYVLRNPDASDAEARAVAAATALLPVVGSALYCALRPKLPES